MKLQNWAAVGVLGTVVMLAGCGPSRSRQSETPKPPAGHAALVNDSAGDALRTGDKVRLSKLGYGCQSQNELARAIEQQNLGAMPALQATIGNYPECITHSEFPAQHWTVTALNPPLVQIGAVDPQDVAAFKKAVSIFAKSGAGQSGNRYWIPSQWLLKVHPQQP